MQRKNLLSQQDAEYDRQNSQLLLQIENNSLNKLETQKKLRSMQSELTNRDGAIAALSRQIERAQQLRDPDYQEIESQIRLQVTSEIHTRDSAESSDPRMRLLKQLSELDPVVMGEIIALNAQYGEFLKSLDVDEQRREIIINALQNMINGQNLARSDAIQQMQVDPQATSRGDLRRQMRAITDPAKQLETLTFDLTEDELAAFAEYQQKRQSLTPSFGRFGTGNGPIFPGRDQIRNGSGQSPAIQISPFVPDN